MDVDQEQQDKAHDGKSPGRGLRLALLASLALNLLLAGLLAGGALRSWYAPAQPAMAEMRALWQVLPAETRRTLRGEFRGREGAARGGGARPGISPILPVLLRAEPFDADAFAAALAALRLHRADRAARAEAALAQRLAEIPASERAAIAERLEDRLDRRAGREGGGGRR